MTAKTALQDPDDIGWVPVDEGLTEDEAYSFLTAQPSSEAALVVASAEEPVVVAAAEVHTGAMIALIPSEFDLQRLAVAGGEDVDQLHLTLAYLGEAAAIDDRTRQGIIAAGTAYFTSIVRTEAFAVNVFNPHNSAMDTALVLGIKGEDLEGPRTDLMSAVRGVFGGMPDNHRPWIPHLTLAYTDDVNRVAEFCDKLGPITFDTLRFAFAGENLDIPLMDPEVDGDAGDYSAAFVLTASGTPRITFDISRLPPALRKYWLGPKGSARVGGWGNPGSYTKCVREMRKEGIEARFIHGLCANLYHEATGHTPNQAKAALTAAVEISQTVEPGLAMEPMEFSPNTAPWSGCLTLEGKESGDGRLFKVGSLDWVMTPPPKLMFQQINAGGHKDSILVGQIQQVWRDGVEIWGSGIVDLDASYNGYNIGREAHRLLKEKYKNGVSVDVDKVHNADVELVFAEGEREPRLTVYNRGRIRGATIVDFPAFVEAQIHLEEPMTASTDAEDCGCTGTPEVLTAASHTITIPDVPPAWWFSEPTDVEMKGALTITDEGRVYGMLAPANVTHRSVKRTVPSNVDYSRFMGAETLAVGEDGTIGRVVTGPVTFNCGHAETDPRVYGTLENRKRHYDNSCSVFADIAIGTSKDGTPWIAGAVKSYATAEQIQQAMSCRLSGDWQPHPDRPGVSEFVAALLVPVPGFAKARTEASVTLEDGVMVACAVPVQFDESSLLLTAAVAKKQLFAHRMTRQLQLRKLELAKKMGRNL